MGRMKRTIVLVLAVLSAALAASVCAATRPTVGVPTAANAVRAERFELVDSEGALRAVLGLQTRLTRRVTIVDAEGNAVVVPEGAVRTGGEGAKLPYLVLMDDAGRTRVEVTFDEAGEPVIRLTDEDGRATYVAPPAHGLKMLGG